jgi:uncharacterized lipoprotein YajG
VKSLVTALALLALAGCQTCDRHPVACLAVATSIALSVPALTNSGAHRVTISGREHEVTTQPVSCVNGSCK